MAPRHLAFFQNLAFLMNFPIALCPVYAVQISAKSSIQAEVINILVNPDGGRRHLGF